MGFFAKLSGKETVKKKTTTTQPMTAKNDYGGVQVTVNADTCCQAAKDIAGQRFLEKDVPKLPLDGCDVQECRCAFQRFDDRRSEPRRLSDVGFDIASQLHDEENRTSAAPGRRDDD